MKITRPLWAPGIFMTPQHFQQQAMWEQFSDERVARIASPDPWGLIRVDVDVQALQINRLQLTTLEVRLPDGTYIDTATADVLPPTRSLDDVDASKVAFDILIGLPLRDAQGGNCIEACDKPARPRRFLREYVQVADPTVTAKKRSASSAMPWPCYLALSSMAITSPARLRVLRARRKAALSWIHLSYRHVCLSQPARNLPNACIACRRFWSPKAPVWPYAAANVRIKSLTMRSPMCRCSGSCIV